MDKSVYRITKDLIAKSENGVPAPSVLRPKVAKILGRKLTIADAQQMYAARNYYKGSNQPTNGHNGHAAATPAIAAPIDGMLETLIARQRQVIAKEELILAKLMDAKELQVG